MHEARPRAATAPEQAASSFPEPQGVFRPPGRWLDQRGLQDAAALATLGPLAASQGPYHLVFTRTPLCPAAPSRVSVLLNCPYFWDLCPSH